MSSKKLKFRPLYPTEERSQAFFDMAERSFEHGSPWSESQFKDTLARTDLVFYVAEQENKLLGYIGGQVLGEEAEIYLLVVDPPYQHQKLASQLTDKFKIWCKSEKVDTVFLEVRASNDRARRFYSKQGFSEIARRKHYYSKPAEDAVIMKCIIGKKDQHVIEKNFSN